MKAQSEVISFLFHLPTDRAAGASKNVLAGGICSVTVSSPWLHPSSYFNALQELRNGFWEWGWGGSKQITLYSYELGKATLSKNDCIHLFYFIGTSLKRAYQCLSRHNSDSQNVTATTTTNMIALITAPII